MALYNLSGPALATPAGITANFVDPPNNNGMASSLLIFMMVISTTCLLVRCYVKGYLARTVYAEDILIVLAYGNYWGCAWASYSLVESPGYFVHNWDLLLGDTILPSCYIFVFGVFYSIVLALLKIVILLDWCRIFVPAGTRYQSSFWWIAMSVVALQGAFGVAAIFLLNFQCIPRKAIWDFTITNKTCIPLNPLQLLSATIHLISDVVIFLLPQKMIWGLNMSIQRRLGVAVVFSLGALAVLCSIFRLQTTIAFGKSPDTIYTIGPVILWATGEMTCGVFVACMPTLPKVTKESAFIRSLKRGIALVSSPRTNSGTGGGGDSKSVFNRKKTHSHNMSRGVKSEDGYLQIDEEGVPMDELKDLDSTEMVPRRGSALDGITRTTHIVVSRD